jgi:hypothetical protein
MPTEIIMPKWGMSMTEGRIARWLKQPGDAVTQGEELVEIESEKISSIVEAPASGTLAKVLVPEGETALVQAVLAYIAAPGEELDLAPASAPGPAAGPELRRPEWLSSSPTTAGASPASGNGAGAALAEGPVRATPVARRLAKELGVELSSISGSGPRGMIVDVDVRKAAEAKKAASPAAGGPVLAAPAARRVARELGLELGGLAGSGPRGMIVEADVRKAAEAKKAAPAPVSSGPVRRVSFYSGGHKLAGVYYAPQGADGPRPGVVLLVGYTYLKEMVVAEMARFLAKHGFAALIFDYRGFGESEGPRGQLLPLEQVADAQAAVTFLRQQSEVDARKLAIVGLSLGGSHAVSAAAGDSRVGAAVAIESPADGERWLRSLRRYSEWLEFTHQVEHDRVQRTLTGQGSSVDALQIVLPDPHSAQFLEQVYAEFPQMRTELSLESAAALIAYSPERVATQLGERPLLIIHGDADRLVPVEEAISLHNSSINSQLDIIPDMGHFDWVFPTHPTFKRVMGTISEWLAEQL